VDSVILFGNDEIGTSPFACLLEYEDAKLNKVVQFMFECGEPYVYWFGISVNINEYFAVIKQFLILPEDNEKTSLLTTYEMKLLFKNIFNISPLIASVH
jgi:hypothetical protein